MKKIFLSLVTLILATGLSAQPLVYTPALKSPVNAAIKQMPNVTVSWYAIAGTLNLQYQVQIDTSANFDSPLKIDHVQSLLTGYTTDKLLFGTQYFWRVRAIDGDTSAWSEIWNYTVFSTVELNTPPDGVAGKDPNTNLVWKNTVNNVTITGVEEFDYQLDTTTDFNSPALEAGTVASTVFTYSATDLRFGTTYYWRVRAKHANSICDWTTPFSFSVLDEVTLKSPANNASDQNLDCILKWDIVVGALTYIYQISVDADFTSLLVETETDSNAVYSSMLRFGTDYYWRVCARHLTDTSGWSTSRKFTTIDEVALVSPANNATGISTLPLMSWEEITGIAGYQLQISADNSFATPYIDFSPDYDATSYQVIKALAAQTKYYWRMRAMSNGGVLADTSQWSTVRSFTTGFGIGIDDPQAAGFSLSPNPASGSTSVRATLPEDATVQFELIDLLGKTVRSGIFQMKAGYNVQDIRLDGLKSSIYVARLTVNGKTLYQKLIVE